MAASSTSDLSLEIFHNPIARVASFRSYQDTAPTVVIMRGIPGSGKSTLADALANYYKGETSIVSADDYFINPITLGYKFNASDLLKAHTKCKSDFLRAIKEQKKIIIVDNTNINPEHFKFYLENSGNYRVVICTPQFKGTSIHNVPQSTIDKMSRELKKAKISHVPTASVMTLFKSQATIASNTQTLAPSS